MRPIQQCRAWLDYFNQPFPEPNPWALTRDELIQWHQNCLGSEVSDNYPEDVLSIVLDEINRGTMPGREAWNEATTRVSLLDVLRKGGKIILGDGRSFTC